MWFIEIISNKSAQKHRVPDTFYTKNDYKNLKRFMKLALNLTEKRQKLQKAQKGKKQVENADLHKPVLNKIITTHK